MVGKRGWSHTDHPPQAFWKDAEPQHGGEVFSVEYIQRSSFSPHSCEPGRTLSLKDSGSDADFLHTGRRCLFQGLAIWEEEKYRRLQGTWPVIFLSFAKVKEISFQNARKKICQIITNLYNQYDFLLESGVLNEKEEKLYQEVNADMEDYLASEALSNLSDYLMRYYGKKVIILLDEYDTHWWRESHGSVKNLFFPT